MIGGRRARAWAPLALLFLLSLPAVATRPHTADEIEYYAFLRSAWFDRDLSFENEYRAFYERGFTSDPLFKATFIDRTTPTGHAVTYATIGCAILWAPFFGVADLGVRLAQLAGSTVAADGYSQPYLAATAYASAFYGAVALVLGAAMARRFTGDWVRTAAVATFAGTPIVFYMYVMPHMSHACSAFAVAVFVWTWLRVRQTWSVGGVAVLALTGALVAMVREQEAFLVIVPAVDYLWSLAGSRSGLAPAGARLVAAAVAFLIGVSPQVIAYIAINGRLAPSPDVANKMYWTAPWSLNVLLSPEHGWFFWTPLAALAVAGLVWMALVGDGRSSRLRQGFGESAGASAKAEDRPLRASDTRRIGVLLLLAIATQVYVSGSVLSWTLAGAFGQRRFVGMTAVVVIGLAWVVSRIAVRSRWLAYAPLVFGVWWNLGLAVQFGENSMDRQRLEIVANARRTFLELPFRAPRIAYRYLFDRGSFYRPPRS